MRIIGGSLRGRRIEAPEGRDTRPMLDRVREAMFSTLAPWLAGARVLDLFAGTGSLGLEALSRGAEHVRFVERGPGAAALLRGNVEELGFEERVLVLEHDALDPAIWGDTPVDIAFLDPRYPMLRDLGRRGGLLRRVEELVRERLAPEGVAMLHAPRRELRDRDLPSNLARTVRIYGTNALWYLQARDEAEIADE